MTGQELWENRTGVKRIADAEIRTEETNITGYEAHLRYLWKFYILAFLGGTEKRSLLRRITPDFHYGQIVVHRRIAAPRTLKGALGIRIEERYFV